MCGIVGYTGKNQSAPVLLNGLAKLEYRGYDSAGIAVRDGDSPVQVVKAKGRLKVLAEKTNDGQSVIGNCGIGHTRWATHGEPSETNAHPHISDDYNVVGVHNGIIENYQELRDKLTRNGYSFYSSTDTEVACIEHPDNEEINYYYPTSDLVTGPDIIFFCAASRYWIGVVLPLVALLNFFVFFEIGRASCRERV